MINIKPLILELSGSTSSLAFLAMTSPKASANSLPARCSPGQVGAHLPPYSEPSLLIRQLEEKETNIDKPETATNTKEIKKIQHLTLLLCPVGNKLVSASGAAFTNSV
jgi:hypothetical protein